MLSLCPKLVFISSSSVFSLLFFSLLTVKVSVEHWPVVWAILSPVPQHLNSGRGLPTLFQQKLDSYVGRWGPPLFPHPSRKSRIAQGVLQLGLQWHQAKMVLEPSSMSNFASKMEHLFCLQHQSTGLPLLNSAASHKALTSAWVFQNTDGNLYPVT